MWFIIDQNVINIVYDCTFIKGTMKNGFLDFRNILLDADINRW